jgi:arsenate reductase
MSKPIIYHNPRCSKSRQTLAILEENGVVPDVVRYLDEPPTPDELSAVVEKLGVAPLEIIRTGEPRFKELGLSKNDERSDDEWLRLIADNPVLLQRPIVVAGRRAAIGRPPEAVLDIL